MKKTLILQVYIEDELGHNADHDIKNADMFSFIKEMYETSQFFAKKYAKRVGADYYVISSMHEWEPVSGFIPTYQKLKLYDLLEYDQILYIDSDYIIKDNAPDIFKELGSVSAVCPEVWSENAVECANRVGAKPGEYFNAGMLYLNKNDILTTKEIVLEYLKEPPTKYFEQDLLNKAFANSSVKLTLLDPNSWNPHHNYFGEYADHYAGYGKQLWDISRYKTI